MARIRREPFEFRPTIDGESRWVPSAGGWEYTTGLGDLNGNGGLTGIRNNSANVRQLTSPAFTSGPVVECIGKLRVDYNPAAATNHDFCRWLNDGGTIIFSCRRNGSTGNIELRRGTTSLQATSTESVGAVAAWHEIHFQARNSNGFCRVYIDRADDDDSPTAFVEFDGDTVQSGNENVQHLEIQSLNGAVFDHITVDAPSLSYDTGVGGAPATGETLTDGTSGATAVIGTINGDATSGQVTGFNPNFGRYIDAFDPRSAQLTLRIVF